MLADFLFIYCFGMACKNLPGSSRSARLSIKGPSPSFGELAAPRLCTSPIDFEAFVLSNKQDLLLAILEIILSRFDVGALGKRMLALVGFDYVPGR